GMARDLDVLLFNALHYPRALKLFPAGVLREPLAYLRRADQVWLTYAQAVSAEKLAAVAALCRRLAPSAALVVTGHSIVRCELIANEGTIELAGRRVLAFCGLGSPEGFEASLRSLGPAELFVQTFPDHHFFSPSDLEAVAKQARATRAEVVVTTAKDAVRLAADQYQWPADAPPLAVAEVELTFLEGVEYVQEVVARWAR
ncbi:MAG: tetraacyldisaccharide 4'-kinase, partial [Armatimonadetes bacterium]|nr:tetraacyldisaccharide 4'-kinase [Armatimonadota bacterium]